MWLWRCFVIQGLSGFILAWENPEGCLCEENRGRALSCQGQLAPRVSRTGRAEPWAGSCRAAAQPTLFPSCWGEVRPAQPLQSLSLAPASVQTLDTGSAPVEDTELDSTALSISNGAGGTAGA